MTDRAEPHLSEPRPPSEDLRIRRATGRASYDRETVNEIIDAALVAHVGTIRDGKPLVIPMLAVRDGDWLLLHGAPASGTVRRGRGHQVCVEMTLLDGLVLARSAFHHSLNYRSVVVLGEAEVIADEDERTRVLETFVERLMPGRQEQLRPTATTEVKQTAVLRISLEKASAKVRAGPPVDEEEDYGWPVWAGVLPVTTRIGQPQPDPRLADGIEVPDHVRKLAGTER
jgi:nitroimidazol reductase NimA-like FMN-containing flavoprotein (pyridoxamine 5'-phosphate oxidase superfamily)